jgi:hypothetical protein
LIVPQHLVLVPKIDSKCRQLSLMQQPPCCISSHLRAGECVHDGLMTGKCDGLQGCLLSAVPE